MSLEVTFDYDFDSSLYMLTKDPDARNWTVVVHCKNGDSHVTSPDKFSEYPGCETHESKIAWYVDYYEAEKVEIQRSGEHPVFIRHPNLDI